MGEYSQKPLRQDAQNINFDGPTSAQLCGYGWDTDTFTCGKKASRVVIFSVQNEGNWHSEDPGKFNELLLLCCLGHLWNHRATGIFNVLSSRVRVQDK